MRNELDSLARLIPVDDTELTRRRTPKQVLEKIHRVRAIYAHWLQFPTKQDRDMVTFVRRTFSIGETTAYEDIRITKAVLGNFQQAGRDFYRWKINQDLEYDLRMAREKGDTRALAAIESARIKNNMTDRPDEPELRYEAIVPQNFVVTENPQAVGLKPIPDLRKRIVALKNKYNKAIDATDNWQTAQAEEIKEVFGEEV